MAVRYTGKSWLEPWNTKLLVKRWNPRGLRMSTIRRIEAPIQLQAQLISWLSIMTKVLLALVVLITLILLQVKREALPNSNMPSPPLPMILNCEHRPQPMRTSLCFLMNCVGSLLVNWFNDCIIHALEIRSLC
jgi:hypothetical protein